MLKKMAGGSVLLSKNISIYIMLLLMCKQHVTPVAGGD